MATYFLDPVSNVNTEWFTNQYYEINQHIRQPATNTSSHILAVAEVEGDANQIYNMDNETTLLYVETITSIKLWVYGKHEGDGIATLNGDINVSGCSPKLLALTMSASWKSVEWTTGNFGVHGITQTILNAMTISLNSIFPAGYYYIRVYLAYLEITTAAIADDPTMYLDPISNNNALWGGNVWSDLNRVTREPTIPTAIGIIASINDDFENQAYNMGGILPYGWRVNRVDYWSYGTRNELILDATDSPWGDINWAGCNEKNLNFTTTPIDWFTVAWTGLSMTSVDGVILYINSKASDQTMKVPVIVIKALYLKLTIEQYIFDTVGPANIAKWNGVLTSNLAKWNGVNWSDLAKYNGID